MELLFPRRIARVSYLCRTILVMLGIGLLASFQKSDSSSEADHFSGVLVVPLLCLTTYWLFFIILPRCRDLAMSGWFTLLVLVPGVGLYFCGYLAWGRTKVRAEWDSIAPATGTVDEDVPQQSASSDSHSEPLRRLEALRDSGVITQGQFERMKVQRRL
jgi:hypothetical protein